MPILTLGQRLASLDEAQARSKFENGNFDDFVHGLIDVAKRPARRKGSRCHRSPVA
jgi:hypothetical protein